MPVPASRTLMLLTSLIDCLLSSLNKVEVFRFTSGYQELGPQNKNVSCYIGVWFGPASIFYWVNEERAGRAI